MATEKKKSVRLLAEKIGVISVFSLKSLVRYADRFGEEGILNFFSCKDIELAADWDGTPGEFCDVLLQLGYLTKKRRTYIFNKSDVFIPCAGYEGDFPWKELRKKVFERDGYICRYCGKKIDNPDCDHVFPLSRGGKNTLENLVTACPRCNGSKRARTPEEWKEAVDKRRSAKR